MDKTPKSEPDVQVAPTKEEVLAELGAILAAHGNLESNIPLTHEYWIKLNLYRGM